MDSGEDPLAPKPPVSDPDPAGLVYGFPVNPPLPPPAPKAPPTLEDCAPRRGNHGGPVSARPDDAAGGGARTTARAVELWRNARNTARAVKSRCDCGKCFAALMLLLASFATIGFTVYVMIILLTSDSSPRLFVSGMHLSSFGVSPSSRQLNGTWHIDFQLLYKDTSGDYISCDGAAVSVYYKGAHLAGTNLHAFLVTPGRPIQVAVNVDAYRSDVPGWLADDLTEDGRLGVAEFEVQFVAEFKFPYEEIRPRTFLCGGLRLGFSTMEEAKLVGDGDIGCPKVAW